MGLAGISQLTRNVAYAAVGTEDASAEAVATGLWLLHVLQVYTSCMVALAVWDWLVCLQMEWRRIWQREWSLIKFLYLWTRYYGLVCFAINLWLFNADFTVERCGTLHYLIVLTCMWVTVGSEMILAVRTYAFLGKKLWIGIALGIALLGEIAFLLYVGIKAVYQAPLPFGNVGPCTASDLPGKHIVMGFWLCPVIFDLICTILTIGKALQLKHMGVKSNVLRIFLREGLLYFVAVAAINILNAAFMFQSDVNLQNINCFLALILSQVLCCRIVLNLRGDGTKNHSTTDSHPHTFTGGGAPPRRAAAATSNFSIPLNTFQGTTADNADDYYTGIKVDVEQLRTEK
ncbi:hypothetical protein V5O48_005451 [Marasmius crinis-equi]|uniref:DUF6533 domain-containing protein n=1 Tax=Marasmius crinis-equi TaxID=585013 RepID=A0ABR3FMC0_9AGAR